MKRGDLKTGVDYAMYPNGFSPRYDNPTARVRVVEPHVQRSLAEIRDDEALYHPSAYGLSARRRCTVLVETVEPIKLASYSPTESPVGTRLYVPSRAIADTWVGYQEKTRQAEQARKRADDARAKRKAENTAIAERVNAAQMRVGMVSKVNPTQPILQVSVDSSNGALYTSRASVDEIERIVALIEGSS